MRRPLLTTEPLTHHLLPRIPLNDDAREKKGRLHSRKARHERQISELQQAATTPAKKAGFRLADLDSASPRSTPRTPRRGRDDYNDDDDDDDDDGDVVVVGSGVTPMKRVPILANFEEWMKMATDNKINATNSWNFALIDYFHDMSLLKDGDGVNFQRASCTLDGCVKIYTSRVDSVATETGKLLSGLADSNSKKKGKEGEGDGEESEEEEVDEDGNVVRKKTKKRVGSVNLLLAAVRDLADSKVATIIRSHAGPIICLSAAQEIRHGVCSRPLIQKSLRRFRRGWRERSSPESPHDRRPRPHRLRQQR